MSNLTGKTAVITGGTRGLGLVTAQEFLAAGAQVVISSRSEAAVQQALESLMSAVPQASLAGMACDVAELEQVQALANFAIQRFGSFEVWINNAGLSAPYGPTAHIPNEMLERVFKTNILGTYHGSVTALAHFSPRRLGKLINILGAGATRPVPYQNGYASSKAWMRVFTLALAKEYRSRGVGIFAYNPGLMFTEMVGDVEALEGYEKRVNALETVLRMWGNPPEVPARRLAWMASAATDSQTGKVYTELTTGRMLGGALQEGLRLLLRKDPGEKRLKIRSVPPALPDLPLPGDRRSQTTSTEANRG